MLGLRGLMGLEKGGLAGCCAGGSMALRRELGERGGGWADCGEDVDDPTFAGCLVVLGLLEERGV